MVEQVIYPNLPLAAYRELAAHLQQVGGIRTQLLPQTSEEFDSQQSQVGGLQVEWGEGVAAGEREQVTAILDYYAQIYGPYVREQGGNSLAPSDS